jgi:hypothetical protein
VLAEDSSSLQEFQTVQKESDDWLSQLFPSIAISRERNREAQKLHSLLPQGDPRSGQSSPPNNKGTGRTANESVKKIGTASKIARSWSREIVAANAVAPEPEPAGDKALLLTSLRERPANADATDWGKFEQLVRTRNTQLETSKKRVYQSLDRMLHAVGDAYGVAQQVIIERHMRRYIDHQIIAASSRTHARNNQKSPVPLRSLDEVVVRHVPANIAGHIVVVGSTMDDMQYLLAALHMRNLEEQKRVTVFVLDEFPTKREWEEAGQYPNVYVMINAREGGGYLRELLARAGTKRANSIIFSTDIAQMRTNQGAADSYVLAGLLDGLYVTINEPHVRVMSELSQGGCNRKMARRLMAGRSAETMNVEQRIQSFSLMEGLGHLDGDYISGHSVSTDLLYLLICQLYYNPYILAIFQQILLGHQLNRELDVDDVRAPSRAPLPPCLFLLASLASFYATHGLVQSTFGILLCMVLHAGPSFPNLSLHPSIPSSLHPSIPPSLHFYLHLRQRFLPISSLFPLLTCACSSDVSTTCRTMTGRGTASYSTSQLLPNT